MPVHPEAAIDAAVRTVVMNEIQSGVGVAIMYICAWQIAGWWGVGMVVGYLIFIHGRGSK